MRIDRKKWWLVKTCNLSVARFDWHERYLSAHSAQNRKGLAGLLTSAHLISIRLINIWLSSESVCASSSFSPPKTLTNLAKCSKCRVISVANIMSIITERTNLYVSRSKFLKILTFSSFTVNWNVRAAWWDSSTQISLYKIASKLFELHRNCDERPGWSMSWAAADIKAVASSSRSINWLSFCCNWHKYTAVAYGHHMKKERKRRTVWSGWHEYCRTTLNHVVDFLFNMMPKRISLTYLHNISRMCAIVVCICW